MKPDSKVGNHPIPFQKNTEQFKVVYKWIWNNLHLNSSYPHLSYLPFQTTQFSRQSSIQMAYSLLHQKLPTTIFWEIQFYDKILQEVHILCTKCNTCCHAVTSIFSWKCWSWIGIRGPSRWTHWHHTTPWILWVWYVTAALCHILIFQTPTESIWRLLNSKNYIFQSSA